MKPHYEAHQQDDGTWDVYHRLSPTDEVAIGIGLTLDTVDDLRAMGTPDEEWLHYPRRVASAPA